MNNSVSSVTSNKPVLTWIKKPVFWAIAIAFIYAAVTLYITIHLMHDSYHTGGFDLGIFTQDLKNTLQGKILYSPAGESQLAHHFSPVLFLLVPIYWLFPHAQTLLVVQGLVLAFAGYLVYVLAREYNYSHLASLILEGLFFVNPLVWGVALFDFHEVVFAIPALLVLFLGLKRKNWIYFWLGLSFALASKEDAILTLGAFGAILIISDYWQHKKVEKTSIIIFCSAILTYGLAVIVSRLSSAGEAPRMLSYYTNRYRFISLPLADAVPLVFKTVFSNGSLVLIGGYLAPLAFVPLLAPKWSIPALLIMLSEILSTNFSQHNLLMQYPAVAIPFLFMAFIIVLPGIRENQQIQSLIKRTNNRAITYSIVFVLLISLLIVPQGRLQLASLPDSHDEAINQVIALVPDNATVSTSNEIFPHLCSRTDVYLFPWQGEQIAKAGGITQGVWGFPDKETEYVVIDIYNQTWLIPRMLEIAEKYDLVLTVDEVRLYRLRK